MLCIIRHGLQKGLVNSILATAENRVTGLDGSCWCAGAQPQRCGVLGVARIQTEFAFEFFS